MKRTNLHICGVLSLLMLLYSCQKDKDNQPVTTNYLKVAEAVSVNSAFNVVLCAEDSLFVGYNKVYVKITNKSDGKSVSQATIGLYPLMDMGTFKHACPIENPTGSAASDGYFEGAILFSMPGTDSWSVDVKVTVGAVTDSVHFALAKVISTTPVKKIVVIDSLETTPGTWQITKYPISLVPPTAWKVGLNPFEITIHKMASMMSFPTVEDMTVEITPEMPSMGHGSPNNVNPVHKGIGHYAGTVNFTMTGDWRIHLTLYRGGRLISDKAYFDILF
jgi:hypothetical protein